MVFSLQLVILDYTKSIKLILSNGWKSNSHFGVAYSCIFINCQELEAQLAAKEVSLPPEPSSDDDNAVNLMVKMPDGSRRGRRFLRSHKLQVKMPVIKYATSVFLLYFGAYILN